MLFSEYCRERGHGVVKRLSLSSKVSYHLVHEAASGGAVSKYKIAKAISEATDGVVSIAELCDPDAPPAPSLLNCGCSKAVAKLAAALSDVAHELNVTATAPRRECS